MKKLLSLVLAMVLFVSIVPMQAFAAGGSTYCAVEPYGGDADLIEVSKAGGARVRTGPGEKYDTIQICPEGTVFQVTKKKLNEHLNVWYQVSYRNPAGQECLSGWIYSENIRSHTHSYQKFPYEDVTYKYCDCGTITVTVTSQADVKKANSLAATAAAATGAMALDGPLPVGDVVGLGILITAGLMDMQILPSVSDVADIVEEIDFDEYKRNKADEDDGSCPIGSYRIVMRQVDGLRYVNENCYNVVEAYLLVRYLGTNVYAYSETEAEALADFCGEAHFCEIDSNKPGYYKHYHFGELVDGHRHANVVGQHIFYGTSNTGERPHM